MLDGWQDVPIHFIRLGGWKWTRMRANIILGACILYTLKNKFESAAKWLIIVRFCCYAIYAESDVQLVIKNKQDIYLKVH